jgi:hypothetical protein
MSRAFTAASQGLEQLAEQHGAPVRSFATTLTCVVAARDRLVVGQIGDGAVVASDDSGALLIAVHPQRGEYANEVYLLGTPQALEHVEVNVCETAAQAVAVITDGLLRLALKLPQYEPHAPFFRPLWEFVANAVADTAAEPVAEALTVSIENAHQQLAAFLSSDRVCARTDDDKTLVLAVRSSRIEPDAAPGVTSSAELGVEPRVESDDEPVAQLRAQSPEPDQLAPPVEESEAPL